MCKIEVKVVPMYSAPLISFNKLLNAFSQYADLPLNSIEIISVRNSHQTYYLKFDELKVKIPLEKILDYFNKLENYHAEEKF
ncbi:MAG: hypothetical protein KJ646_02565 [Nanoarchaeota archaeon]|nr:hypothetical protein [Nanoarchaeota archaeon]MBU4116458.1 hypothetical protein [Nanoarchaeota archaeon]